ncbi:hypothetical protein [Salipiger mangrovisoli]|uniref:Uncharacterized protein n=1 Tax=Salipiger mangrovisoli TaxID=2865933 RepID=A0ABR9WXS8_9RHOB|nr:hypothetical protein [Salipiger mangrovisoli]MBE9636093.1 hypothetical protein [Salipiger mangrovisoli]
MSDYILTKTRFREGVWHGLLAGPAGSQPEIDVTLDDAPVRGVTLAAMTEPGRWALEVPVPLEAVGDGVRTFLIREAASGAVLDSFTLIAGEALGDDIRAEMALLRAELDLLKRAFRRHCLETERTAAG